MGGCTAWSSKTQNRTSSSTAAWHAAAPSLQLSIYFALDADEQIPMPGALPVRLSCPPIEYHISMCLSYQSWLQGVANVAAAAKDAGLNRVVLVTSRMVTPQNRYGHTSNYI